MGKNNKIEVKEDKENKPLLEDNICMKKECLCKKRLIKKAALALSLLVVGGIIGSHIGFRKAIHHTKGYHSQFEQSPNKECYQSQQFHNIYKK